MCPGVSSLNAVNVFKLNFGVCGLVTIKVCFGSFQFTVTPLYDTSVELYF
jgi:hypothetical protein